MKEFETMMATFTVSVAVPPIFLSASLLKAGSGPKISELSANLRSISRTKINVNLCTVSSSITHHNIYHSWHRKAATKPGSAEDEDQKLEDLKKSVMRAVANTNRGKATAYDQRRQILKLIEELEAENPTNDPVNSDLLSGCWSLLYTAPVDEKTADKYAGTEEGPFLARLKPLAFGFVRQTRSSQVIDTFNAVVKNIAEFMFFGMKGILTIKGRVTRSPKPGKERVRVDVTFEEFVITLGGWNLPTVSLSWVNPEGWVDTTFLDKDLRVGRGDKGSIFVSARVKS